tara:strand:- start:992 stop:1288 length:297 start_codon:yes stop_codon:yes gene_type:complete
MLKSHILEKLQEKYNQFSSDDIENVFEIFTKKIIRSLKDGKNIELRGFGTITKKINREKYVRNPKTNQRIFKNKSFKLHFKIGKILHNRINSSSNDEF